MNKRNAADLQTAYRAHIGQLKKVGREWHGPCPACGGEDRFWIREDGVIGCRGDLCPGFGEIMSRLGFDLEPESTLAYPRSVDTPAAEIHQFPGGEKLPKGCTLAQYAQKTGLPEEFLRGPDVQLSDDQRWYDEKCGNVPAVRFPSFNENFDEISVIHRVAVTPREFRYQKRSGPALYGEQWAPVARQQGSVIVVEGQSDAQTCWRHKIPCYGIPGADLVKVIEPRHVEGVRNVWVVQESNAKGAKFPAAVEARLREIGSSVEVIPVPLPVDDVNDLYKLDTATFKDRFRRALRDARKRAKTIIWRPAAKSANAKLERIDWLCWPMLRPSFGILWAPSYAGKTTLIQQICVAVALGLPALGCIATKKTGVRFVGLEQGDTADKRRMWEHIGVRPGQLDGVDFEETDKFPRMGDGCLAALDRMLKRSPSVGLVVIDNLNRIHGSKAGKRGNAFYDEGAMLERMERLQKGHKISLILIHHSDKSGRKASGSEAIYSVPRTTIHLDRPDQDQPFGKVSAWHNGAPGGKFNVKMEPGLGWRVCDQDFEHDLSAMGFLRQDHRALI